MLHRQASGQEDVTVPCRQLLNIAKPVDHQAWPIPVEVCLVLVPTQLPARTTLASAGWATAGRPCMPGLAGTAAWLLAP